MNIVIYMRGNPHIATYWGRVLGPLGHPGRFCPNIAAIARNANCVERYPEPTGAMRIVWSDVAGVVHAGHSDLRWYAGMHDPSHAPFSSRWIIDGGCIQDINRLLSWIAPRSDEDHYLRSGNHWYKEMRLAVGYSYLRELHPAVTDARRIYSSHYPQDRDDPRSIFLRRGSLLQAVVRPPSSSAFYGSHPCTEHRRLQTLPLP